MKKVVPLLIAPVVGCSQAFADDGTLAIIDFQVLTLVGVVLILAFVIGIFRRMGSEKPKVIHIDRLGLTPPGAHYCTHYYFDDGVALSVSYDEDGKREITHWNGTSIAASGRRKLQHHLNTVTATTASRGQPPITPQSSTD